MQGVCRKAFHAVTLVLGLTGEGITGRDGFSWKKELQCLGEVMGMCSGFKALGSFLGNGEVEDLGTWGQGRY